MELLPGYDPTIYFNDGSHYHFDDTDELLHVCQLIFDENIVFSLKEPKKEIQSIYNIVESRDDYIDDRYLVEEILTDPTSSKDHILLDSWFGTHRRKLRWEDLDSVFQYQSNYFF